MKKNLLFGVSILNLYINYNTIENPLNFNEKLKVDFVNKELSFDENNLEGKKEEEITCWNNVCMYDPVKKNEGLFINEHQYQGFKTFFFNCENTYIKGNSRKFLNEILSEAMMDEEDKENILKIVDLTAIDCAPLLCKSYKKSNELKNKQVLEEIKYFVIIMLIKKTKLGSYQDSLEIKKFIEAFYINKIQEEKITEEWKKHQKNILGDYNLIFQKKNKK
jgi:hypothetical protein